MSTEFQCLALELANQQRCPDNAIISPWLIGSRIMAACNDDRSTRRRGRIGAGWWGRHPAVTSIRGCRYLWLFLFLLAGEQPLGDHIVLGNPKDLVEGRLTLDRLDDPVLEQSAHPLLASQSTYHLR